MIAIWDEVCFKLTESFDGLVTSKEVLSDSCHHNEENMYVVIEVLEIQSSVSFKLFLDEELIEFLMS